MLSRLGAFGQRRGQMAPWTNVYGLARTLLALGTLGTLLFSSSTALFRPASGIPDYPHCDGPASLGLFCIVPTAQLEVARLIGVAILIAVASGWRPRLTALPHWWVAFSLQASATIPDGGDQVTAIVTLLLLPIALTDRRRWHWYPAPTSTNESHADGYLIAALVAWSALLVIRLQVAGIYLQSSMAKLGVEEWVDGTALYYWLRDPWFGAPPWTTGPVELITANSVGVLLLTWGPLLIEFALVLGLISPRSVRPYLLVVGIALHASIAILMGLGSFAFAMAACLVLYLRPLEAPIHEPAWLVRRVRTMAGRA